MNKQWTDDAWKEYLYWQSQDKHMLKKINELIKDIERNRAAHGIGKPEPLRYRQGYYSRRIDEKNRIVYIVLDGVLHIASCKGPYQD